MLRAVATDGHRLAQVELPLPSGAKDMPGVIVPRKTVVELARLVEDGEGEVRIELSPSKIRVSTRARGAHLQADRRHLPRLRAGHPARQRQEDGGRQRRLRAGRRSRLDAVERQGPRGEAHHHRRQAHAVGQQSRQRQRHRGASRSTMASIRWRSASTPAICSTFRGQLESGTAEFQLADPGSPTMVRDGKDASALYVLMPMRV